MRRSARLFPAALLCVAASIGGRTAADPSQVLVQNGSNVDVLITLTDLNTPHGGVIIATQKPLAANGELFIGARLDAHGDYHLHWKTENEGRTKEQEGDCHGTPVFPCRVELFFG